MSPGECELSKPVAIEVMRREAEAVGMTDVYIDAHCIEMDVKEFKKTIVSCKDVEFTLFGLSLATINVIISLILSVITFKLFLNYEKNK